MRLFLIALALALSAAAVFGAEPPRAWSAAPPVKVVCVCGPACACPPNKCPAACPDEVAVSTTGRTLHRRGTVWTFADEPKPAAKAAPVVVGYTFTRVCNGGVCQIVKTPVYAK
jgi:hypothetical protein